MLMLANRLQQLEAHDVRSVRVRRWDTVYLHDEPVLDYLP